MMIIIVLFIIVVINNDDDDDNAKPCDTTPSVEIAHRTQALAKTQHSPLAS